MQKSERFGMVLSPDIKYLLEELARSERISKAAVIRRLIWLEAQRWGITDDVAGLQASLAQTEEAGDV